PALPRLRPSRAGVTFPSGRVFLCSMSKRLCLVGQRFGKLNVLFDGVYIAYPNGQWKSKSVCECDCGRIILLQNYELLTVGVASCHRCSLLHHGHSTRTRETPTYTSWQNMISRCRNPNRTASEHYVRRGISVCERWKLFENFLADMGERPEGKELDRWPNNNGNYEPGNCRWATRREQMENTRRSRIFTVDGITGCLKRLSEHFGVPYETVRNRLKRGVGIDDALYRK